MIICFYTFKTIRLLALCALLLSAHASAQDALSALDSASDPVAIVNSFYDGSNNEILWPDDPKNPSQIHSSRLAELYAESLDKRGQFALTFDPIVNGQDALISNLVVYPSVMGLRNAQIIAHFHNFDTENILVYSFIWQSGEWKLDEIASINGDARWLLTDILVSD